MSLLTITLIIGTLVTFAVMCWTGRLYSIPVWKIAVSVATALAVGVLGAHVMALIEVGKWRGTSIYGAIFFILAFIPPLALALRIPITDLADASAPAIGFLYALMKIRCHINGCCFGRIVGYYVGGVVPKRFPSQLVESAVSFVIALFILLLIHKKSMRGRIAPLSMILYGTGRFILNYYRDTKPFVLGLPAGNLWSLVSIVIGVVWLLFVISKRTRKPVRA